MSEQPTIDVHQDHGEGTSDERVWPQYRWMCSECGQTGIADTSPNAREEGNQHVAEHHKTS